MSEERERQQRRYHTAAAGANTIQPVNFLPAQKEAEATKRRRRRQWLLTALLILFGLFSWRAVLPERAPENPLAYDPVTLAPKPPQGFFSRLSQLVFTKETTLAGKSKDRINVLLLGMGGPGHDGPFLTDTIILASIKPSTGQVSLLSIPRDLGVKIPGHGWQKINHANAYGEADQPDLGAALTTTVIEETFDVDIPYYARVDFQAFADLIDLVDGVNINVERAFTDTQFPASAGRYQTISFTKGIEKMNGQRALQYARSRHGNNSEGSDFARARRQQQVLLALKDKLLSFQTLANPVRINAMLNALDKHLTTNMEFADMMTLVRLTRGLEGLQLTTLILDASAGGWLDDAYTEDGAYILEPKTGDFKEIRQLVNRIFDYTDEHPPTPAPQEAPAFTHAKLEIQNGTWRAGLAARIRQQLKSKGLKVTTIGNTNQRPLPASGIYNTSGITAPDVLETIKTTLNIPIKQAVLAEEAAASTTDILVILGEDFVE